MATSTETTTATEFNLTPPEPIPTIDVEKAVGLVPVDEAKKTELDGKVDEFVAELLSKDAKSPEFGKRVDEISNMGRKEIVAAASHSNRFLDRPIRAMDKDEGVGANLAELRKTVEELDPAKRGQSGGLLSKLPFGNSLKSYFRSYQSAQTHIQAVLDKLASGRRELLMDNSAIDVERQKLWEAMGKLEQMIHISKALDTKLEEKANELDATDPEKAKVIRETALFYVRQRTQDFLTQMAVSVQGYLALDLVKKNNVELVKGVDRASTTTVSALRTAVTVSEAMTNQRLVLQQITALNDTTAGIIDSTGKMLREQTGKIHEQAAASTIPMETLKQAFQNIYATMDEVDEFKAKALITMKETVEVLSEEVDKSKGYLARAESQAKTQAQLDAGEDSVLRLGE